MKNIFITGATGNVGQEVVRYFYQSPSSDQLIVGVRNVERAKKMFHKFPNLQFREFDFETESSFASAFENVQTIFLLRPPHISNVKKFFRPLIQQIKASNIQEIVFLSVQGAEKSSVIPHNKIEKLIEETHLSYIFLRPSYFMQNLTTTLLQDIQKKRQIILPAGNAKFNWIDVENIGEVSSLLLQNFEKHKNQILELTGDENLNFGEVVEIINKELNHKIKFCDMNPIQYYFTKHKDKIDRGMIFVMIMLHYLQRFQDAPKVSTVYENLTKKKPTDLKTFVERNKALLEKT